MVPIKQASCHSVVLLSNRNRKTIFDNRSRYFFLVITDLLLRSDHFVIDRGDVHKVDSMSALGQQAQRRDELASSATQSSYLHDTKRDKKRDYHDDKCQEREAAIERKNHILEEDEQHKRGGSDDADSQTLRDYMRGVK